MDKGRSHPIDVYSCRFLRAYRPQRGFRVPRSIPIGLDWAGAAGEAAYYDRGVNRIFIKECVLPWENWRMETLRDGQLLEDCLRGLKYRFEDAGLGRIEQAAVAVPYSFSYFQRMMIMKAARNAGIEVTAMDTAGVFACMSRYCDGPGVRALVLSCNLRAKDFEVSLVSVEEGYFESLGSVGIKSDQRWDSLSEEDFARRIRSELKQFFRDTELVKRPDGLWAITDAGAKSELHILMCGESVKTLDDVLLEMTGVEPEEETGIASAGALLQCMVKGRYAAASGLVRLASYDKNIWIGLGDNGENSIIIDRYTNFPVVQKKSLLLSTETDLRIYEGNYFNPAFDCLLADIPLDGLAVEEGKEITCELSIEVTGALEISVYNHEHVKVIDKYRL